uniref:Cohesin domain-containing protein n=1 Tax=Panagrolaimus davidi TaxID=227884 RepID=A0A914PZL0_9BILA
MKNKCPFLCLLSFIAQFYFSAANTIQDIARIQFSPNYIHDLLEGQNVTVNVRIRFDSDEFFNSEFYNKPFKVSVKTLHNEVATSDIEIIGIDPIDLKVVNESLEYNFNTTIDTHFMGKTALQVRLISGDSISKSGGDLITLMELSTDDERQDFGSELKPIKGASRMDLWVIREKDYNIHEAIFVAVLVFLITIANFLMGCEIFKNGIHI